ncbi:ATP-binding cassette domain-containing protein [Acidiferrimicrobium sp. IK]|uniref:ATP-binding cassette domain-containing protein n=1 Tax=Acidiferrimicrobium sp. IK TaxID=2871700 RepID=UPI0021CB769E|nr:ATP-binding cassette domain-containing protein [Acidiferrimicrobium sp. IK]MCU4182918.1 ATP-binding cassette domain-containing protein [Acidiferrimicrobium sp. IK]
MTDTTSPPATGQGRPNGAAAGGGSLECSGVTVRFGGLVALDNVDLAVPPGTIVGLVGPNGAGKSTLFGVLSGLLRPSAGSVHLGLDDVTDDRPQARSMRGLARTFQHPELFTGLTVRDHLVLAHRARHAKRRVWTDLLSFGSLRGADPAETAEIDGLVRLLGMEGIADRPALGLPLGSARLVELGRALATTPSILLLDEPSSGLDSSETEQFEAVLLDVARSRGISVLLVEHDVEMVMRLCATIYVLDFGSVIAKGAPEEIRANPAVRAAYLGDEVTAATSRNEPTLTPVAEELPASAASRVGADATPAAGEGSALLEVTDLAVRYGDALALQCVSLTVHHGQALAVLGVNGAGKSTLARALSGLVPASHGSITLDGQDITGWAAHRIRRAGIVHLPEGRGIFRSLTVQENLRMASAVAGDRRAARDALDLAMSIFPILGQRRRQLAGLLSGGEQQMLSLARALATSPRVVIADELSLGLAPMMVDVVFEGLARARDEGVTVIMIEQFIHRALGFADRCIVMQRGQVSWSGPATNAAKEVLRRYLGDSMTAGA